MLFALALAACTSTQGPGAASEPFAASPFAREAAAEPAVDEPPAPSVAPSPTTPEPLVSKVIQYESTAHSTPLASGYFNPFPGGVLAGYLGDTGLDIAGTPRPVYAVASGTLDYSEAGHTLWTGPRDTANCIRIELDQPITFGDHSIKHMYYAHLSKLAIALHEGASPRVHVQGGDYLGESGVARGSPHLHLGFLLDGEVEQYWGTFLREDAIRKVMGGLRNGARLPRD